MINETENTQLKQPKQGRSESLTFKAWREFFLKLKQDEVARIEDAAKFLTGLSSVLFTILQVQNLRNVSMLPSGSLAIVGFIFWLFSLGTSLLVLFPARYSYSKHGVAKYEQIYNKIANYKFILLIVSTFCFFCALVLIVFQFFLGQNHKLVDRSIDVRTNIDTVYMVIPPSSLPFHQSDSTTKKKYLNEGRTK